jgi:hypothetical protein
MVFRPPPKPAEFADLKGMLAQSKNINPALYQTISVLIDRLEQLRGNQADVVDEIGTTVRDITNNINITTNTNATYLMHGNESLYFPKSRTLLAGPGIIFDDQYPNQRYIVASGGAGGGMNLDYLGNYVQGPVYNDGDIVIGQDGVAYMCTVDGTVTPPEPWPGVGVAANIALDATYWVVSPHTYLTNARPLNALGTGYVRSTAGEPSVVQQIPDAHLTSNVALKNIDNFFVGQTFSSYSTIRGGNSLLTFYDTSAPGDAKVWRWLNYSNGHFYLEALNDTQATVTMQYLFGRDGNLSAGGFVGSGYNLHSLNAANLAYGTVPLARLGTNAPTPVLYLAGDNTWKDPAITAVPSGLMMLSDAPCPVGWTRVSAYDNLFIRTGATGGIGGSDTHSHSAGSFGIPAHNHTGETNALGTHSHSVSIHQGTGTESAGTMNADAGQSGNVSRGLHYHGFDYDGRTGDDGFHSHTVNLVAAGAIAVGGQSADGPNVPRYVTLFLCRKN